MKTRCDIRSIAICAMLTGALISISSTLAMADDTLRLAHNRAWSNPALLIGLSKGNFTTAGVKVAETEFTNPADMITAIAGGSVDAATSPSTTLASAVQKGVKVKAVALVQGNSNPPIAYTVLTTSGINSAADLKGKNAGVNNYGGSHDLVLRDWLEQAGINPKDVNILTVPVPAMPAALINKQVDIVPFAAADIERVKQMYPGRTRVLFDYADVYRKATGADDMNGMLLVVSQAYIDRDRATLVKFLRGYLTAVRAMNANPKAALADWSNAVGNKSLLELPAPPTIPNDGKVYMKALQYEVESAIKFGYLQGPSVNMNVAVDNSLIEEAARSLN
jgi:ABC-type nitrate/sulfonate/bicarbonate transport system substrate-binding protein